MNDRTNPYAAPQCLPSVGGPMGPPIAVSRLLKNGAGSLTFLVLIQLIAGAATAVVIDQEGVSAHGFVVGMALFAIVLSAFVTYAAGYGLNSWIARSCWATAVAVIAWGCFLIGFWSRGKAMYPPAGISPADLPLFAIISGITVGFCLMFDSCVRRIRNSVR
jgi:hypothetical protein